MKEEFINDLLCDVQRLLNQVISLKKEAWKSLEDEILTLKSEKKLNVDDSIRLEHLFSDFRYFCDSKYIDSLRVDYDLNTMCIKLRSSLLSADDMKNLHFVTLHPGDNACLFLHY